MLTSKRYTAQLSWIFAAQADLVSSIRNARSTIPKALWRRRGNGRSANRTPGVHDPQWASGWRKMKIWPNRRQLGDYANLLRCLFGKRWQLGAVVELPDVEALALA